MQINTGAPDIYNLFSSNGTTSVSVPSFQRNYSWTKDQVGQFVTDIFECARDNNPHFWGPIVVLRDPKSPAELQIIDGQQRITTAMIFLSILRDRSLELTDRIIHPGTPGAYDIAPIVRNFLFQPPLYATPRFSGSYLIDDILKKFVLADPSSPAPKGGALIPRPPLTVRGAKMSATLKTQTKELRSAYLLMSKSIDKELASHKASEQKNFIASVFTALTTNFEIHTMELINEDDAYLLFESLNDRGLRLNPSDLLKTFTLREVKNNPGATTVQQALEDWDDMVENLGDFDFTKFLRHYLLTKTDGKVQTGKIFTEFKRQIGKLGKNGALQNLTNVKAASENYAILLGKVAHTDKDLTDSFVRMNGYSDTHRVFLLGMLEAGLPIGSLHLLTRTIEFLSFRWIAAGKNAQDLENLYQESVRALLAKPTAATATQIAADLMKKAPNEPEFDDLTRTEAVGLERYILRRIESSTGGAIAGVPHIEHLAPQKPAKTDTHWFTAVAKPDVPDTKGFDYDDYKTNWGNLTLLEDSLNKSIKNSPWPTKVKGTGRYEGISASNYNINSHIKTLKKWSGPDILRREKWIKKCISELVSAKWVKTGKATITMWDGK